MKSQFIILWIIFLYYILLHLNKNNNLKYFIIKTFLICAYFNLAILVLFSSEIVFTILIFYNNIYHPYFILIFEATFLAISHLIVCIRLIVFAGLLTIHWERNSAVIPQKFLPVGNLLTLNWSNEHWLHIHWEQYIFLSLFDNFNWQLHRCKLHSCSVLFN